MDPNDQHWLALLDIFAAWGEAGAKNDTSLPTDDELWAAARQGAGTGLSEQIDADLLAELREAFNSGRQPTRIDMQAVAEALHDRGHRAYVEHTGGGTATLYAGRQVPIATATHAGRSPPGRAGSRHLATANRSPTPASSTSAPTATTPGRLPCPSTPRRRRSPR